MTLAVHDPDGPRYLVIARDITAQKIERTAHERRHSDLEAERAVANAVSETLEIETVLDVALEQVLAALRMEAGAIYLADDAQKELSLTTARNLSHAFVKPVLFLRFGEGLTGTAAAERQVILAPDLDRDARVIPAQREDTSIRSQASVPLIVQNRVVGVLNVMACETRAFTNEDASLLLAIASNVAVAIDHARLFDSLERRVAERTDELATLNRIARALSTTLKLDDLLEIVYREISAAMDTDAFFVALYDPSTTELDFRIRVDAGIREPVQRRLIGPGLTSYVVTNRRALLIRHFDLEKDHLPTAKIWGSMQVPQSWLGVPMLLGDRLVGVISVQAYQPNAYTLAAQEFLSTIADTVALAVENARLFEETARRAEQLTILREIDRTLSSMLDLKPMLETTLSRLEEIVPYDSAAVFLLDGNILRAATARGRGDARLKEFTLDISDNSIFLEMDLKRVPIIIDNLKESSLWVDVPGLEFARAWLGAPLIARGDMIGQIGVFSAVPGSFTREHSDLMHSFANHTAIAIANARMHTELQDQARRDSLTQVLNHSAFITDLHAATERGQALAMIMFDLDDFKRYNDTYGHVVGDAVLKAVVQAIRAHIKKSDFVGRWGGEEFGIALRGTNTARAMQVAARIRTTLAQTLIRDRLGQPISPPTASQGVSALPETANSVDELIEQADRALYRAKALGRDQVVTACDRAIEQVETLRATSLRL